MTRMFRIILAALIVTIMTVAPAYADGRPSKEQRDRWFKEMQQYKREYLVKEMDLTDEQKAKFLPVYDNMEQEIRRLHNETRQLVRDVDKKGDKATALEREKAAEASFELRSKEGAIEMKYYKEMKSFLSPDQLLKFKKAEDKFTRELMKHRHRGPKKK